MNWLGTQRKPAYNVVDVSQYYLCSQKFLMKLHYYIYQCFLTSVMPLVKFYI